MGEVKEKSGKKTFKKVLLVVAGASVLTLTYCFGKYGVKGTANKLVGGCKNMTDKFRKNKPVNFGGSYRQECEAREDRFHGENRKFNKQ